VAASDNALAVNRRLAYRLMILAMLVAAGALLVYVYDNGVTGDNETSAGVPSYVNGLVPPSGRSVLRQNQVGIYLQTGYDAYLNINGVTIKNVVTTADGDGLHKTLTEGIVTYQPMPGHRIAELAAGQNCVTATVWSVQDGPSNPLPPIYWCFMAA
jgi:hypothetical protein